MSSGQPPVPTGPATRRVGRATNRWRVHLPMGLLAVLFLLFAAFVATQADAHGRSWDEGAQDWYGEAVYQWYVSGGADQTFMRAAPQLQMPQHGPVAELVIAAAQHAFADVDRWQVRSVVGGVIGGLGVVGIALCGLELGGWWVAFLSAAGLALYPRYTGAIFNNSKDIPLAVAMIFLLWLTLRLARRWSGRSGNLLDSALVGACLGVAVSIRVNALLWLGVLAGAAAWWWWRQARSRPIAGGSGGRMDLARPALAGVVIVGCAYLTMLILWPYVALHPIDGLVDSVRSMSRYAWTGQVLFAGELVRADQLPRGYAPVWLVVGSPLPTVLFGLLGAGFVIGDLVRRRLGDARVLFAAALVAVPLAAILIMRPTLYNGSRHFLFVVPGLIVLGSVGLLRLWSLLLTGHAPRDLALFSRQFGRLRLRSARSREAVSREAVSREAGRRVLAAGLAAVTVLAWAQVVVAAARLYPFEYMYFSPVVGGYLGARDSYETDYWGVCQNPALDWLVEHHRAYATPTPPALGGLFDPAVRTPPGFTSADPPDFFISGPYYPVPAGYLPIHRVIVEGTTLCTVNINPAYLPP